MAFCKVRWDQRSSLGSQNRDASEVSVMSRDNRLRAGDQGHLIGLLWPTT